MGAGNCLRALGGWLAGCATATLTLYAFLLVAFGMAPNGDAMAFVAVSVVGLCAVPIAFIAIIVLSGFPAVLAIWLSEKFRLRSFLFFGGAGFAIGGSIPFVLYVVLEGLTPAAPIAGSPFALAGLAAGLTYWLVAGKHAGRNRSGDAA